MYELEEHHPEVAEQVATLPRRASSDYEAAIVYILTHPWDADVFNVLTTGNARMRRFGLDRGTIVYTPVGERRTVRLDWVSFTS